MRLGSWAEDLACRHLIDRGLILITRNYRCRHGEIDLVMRDTETIAFIEVRLRSRTDFGSGADSVDARKQARLISSAEHYLQRHANIVAKCRFDVVSITRRDNAHRLEWIRNAFTA
ncbi:MAG: YraN family protein [Gammaproteobacteria bacterium]|nr:YraN family protein [Gammaproteobacteria bacterium]NIP89326.1 YraN family protein [Gammaproteobacteria bacterium]NIR24160.1 YraN family protein [Gammaproteobacteria bacterium]NIS05829.1 YraN family protein [Gammaproteobacteria bacterium]NIU41068.1 YraN family protein [Gammaproteobacteria bacterium]